MKKLKVLLKEIKDFFLNEDDAIDDKEKEYLDSIPKQNSFGLISMVLGGVAFTFGPTYGFIPVLSIVFCMSTYKSFDKEKEDNPWTFYIGIALSLIGLVMYIQGVTHHLIL
ncbi:cell division protein FtsK [Sporosarcina obsidiansis]|uniref:cell division protein FtsK n=1 Tax=Sporosarcina obsidiansis TaxID=2660748 RepID=UPI00129AF641|nr:cell division protein FtsK [Sporosarcina obsidiansis]